MFTERSQIAGASSRGAKKRISTRLGKGQEPSSDSYRVAKNIWEARYLLALMRSTNGVVAKAARRAGMARGHFYRLLARHGVELNDLRS